MVNYEYYNKLFNDLKCCVVIPTYNNASTLGKVISELLLYTKNIIVVNDGSNDDTLQVAGSFAQNGIININNETNKGKGYSLKKGFSEACRMGFEYALTIDSDGQHLVSDVPLLIDKIDSEIPSIVIGTRDIMASEVPAKSSFGRKFSNFWFKFETGISISDTQSGFRIYPLKSISGMKFITNKYDFEIDILVRCAWRGIKIQTVPVTCVYLPEEIRVSHFKPVRDFSRVSLLNSVLVIFSVFWFKPVRFFKSLNKKSIKAFLKENVVNSRESNTRLAVSLAFGIFMGIIPIWGWQLAVAIPLAILLRLNKVIVITSANISIPPNIPIILFLSYKLGGVILGSSNNDISSAAGISFQFVYSNLYQYVIGALSLALISSVFLGFLSYFILKIFRKRKPA